MQVQIYIFAPKLEKDRFTHDLVASHLGYAEIEEFDAEDVWALCNWSSWSHEKPDNLHADISSCGHGLCVVNPETDERWLALSHGWLVGNEKKISDYVFEHRNDVIWRNE